MKTRDRFAAVAASALAAAAFLGASGASAATEFGHQCAGNGAAPNYTLTGLTKPGGGIPLTAPVAGVLTKVRVTTSPMIPFALPTQIKLLRATGPNTFTTVNQVSAAILPGVANEVPVRLPIQVGDQIGLRGEPTASLPEGATLYCAEILDGSRLGARMGDVPPGGSGEFTDVTEGSIPAVGVIEADADGDGYGDESQDGCPQRAAFQIPCPTITFATVAKAGAQAATVLVSVSSPAPVKVSGVVKLGGAGKAKLTAAKKTVNLGKLGRFRLQYPGKLKEALKELAPGNKLNLKITAAATNAIGTVTRARVTVKLKGQSR